MTWRLTWLSVTLVAALGVTSPVYAQVSQPEPTTDPAKAVPLDLFGLGGATRAASDLRSSGEAFDRLGRSLKELMPTIADALIEVSGHLAEMSSAFDPFGYKTAFQTIAKQNEIIKTQSETIQELLRADIERLHRELERTKKTTAAPKKIKSKKGKK